MREPFRRLHLSKHTLFKFNLVILAGWLVSVYRVGDDMGEEGTVLDRPPRFLFEETMDEYKLTAKIKRLEEEQNKLIQRSASNLARADKIQVQIRELNRKLNG